MQFSNTNITISNYNSPFPENDINRCCSISSKFQDPNSNNFMFNFPNSPHIHLEYEDAYNQFLEFFDQHKPIENQNPPVPTTEITTAVDEYQPPPLTTAAGRKRFGKKKDRHSKINTARGPRDRRMRLSLEVARKFFDLQDSLGYDKASRTVDWLLKNAKRAIRELKRSNGTGGGSCSFNMDGTAVPAHSGSVSVSSDGCEVVSSNHSTTTTAGGAAVVEPHPPPPTKPKRIKKIRAARATVAKDSRRRARERARERTSQKRRLVINEINTIDQPKIYSKSLTESHGSCSRAPMQPNTESQDLNSDQTRPNPLVYSATWNSSAIILDNDYQDNAAGLFSHQIADEFDQYCGKPWEAYSSSFNNLSG